MKGPVDSFCAGFKKKIGNISFSNVDKRKLSQRVILAQESYIKTAARFHTD